ncbi:MAG: AraC family transcriptional regulator ligand-binding domain-containing protein [Gammaproteobacteria bacterium]
MKHSLSPEAHTDEPASIAIEYSRMMARQLGLNEKNLEVLLKQTGLEVEAFMDDGTLLTKHQQLQIVRNAMQRSGNPAYGLDFGRTVTPPTHGPLGFLANSSPDLDTAILNFASFIPGRINLFTTRTEYHDHDLHYFFDVDTQDDLELYRCVSEAYFLSVISLIEFVTGEKFSEGAMHCAYAEPPYVDEYARYIHCTIRFNSPANLLIVPQNLLQRANVSSNHQSYRFALEQCQRMLEDLDDTNDPMTLRVRRQLLSHPPGKLTEDDTARLNFISKRTLARRLTTEKTSFRALKEQVQMSLALGYLRDTKLSVEAVAALLNYHDSSSFRRAFKRWTEMTPQGYRLTMQ